MTDPIDTLARAQAVADVRTTRADVARNERNERAALAPGTGRPPEPNEGGAVAEHFPSNEPTVPGPRNVDGSAKRYRGNKNNKPTNAATACAVKTRKQV